MVKTFSFDVNCTGLSVNTNNHRLVTVTLDDVEKEDILTLFDVPEFIEHYGDKEVIGYIDQKYLDEWAESNGYTKE